MSVRKYCFIMCLILLSSTSLFSQELSTCGNQTRPLSDSLVDAIMTHAMHDVGRAPTYKIPVVFHVFNNGATDAQLLEVVDDMNRDFRTLTAIAQRGGAVDIEVEFCLAKIDPSGNPTTGIVQHTGTATRQLSGIYNVLGVTNPFPDWNVNNYLNIWVVDAIDYHPSSGYTLPPGAMIAGLSSIPWNTAGNPLPNSNAPYSGQISPTTAKASFGYDGFVVNKDAIGNNDNRVFTHEIGHYLGLPHTFIGAGCANGDGLICTPDAQNYNGTQICAPLPACAGHAENYMQYWNNACIGGFLGCQKSVMRYVLDNQRQQLRLGNVCDPAYDVSINSISATQTTCQNFDLSYNFTNLGSQNLTDFDVLISLNGAPYVSTTGWSGNIAFGVSQNRNMPGYGVGNVGSNTVIIKVVSSSINTPNRSDQDLTNDSAIHTFNITAPGGSVAITASSNTICEGESVTLTASGGTGYSWMPGGSTANSITVSPTATTVYTLSGSVGGCSSSATESITVNALPTTNFTRSTNNTCPGDAVTLTASGATSYSWASGGTNAIKNVSPNTTTSYTVTGTTNGCSVSRTRTVTVNAGPNLSLINSVNTLCETDQVTLTASGANTYSWSTGESTPSITRNQTTDVTYTVTGTSNGCSQNESVTITHNLAPTLLLVSSEDTLCGNDPVTLTASGATTYLWSTGDVTPSITETQSANVTYTVTGTSNGCSASESRTIVHNSYSNLTLVSSVNTVCGNDPVTLTASGLSSYLWSTGETTPSITRTQTADVTYTVTGSAGGCSVSESKTITHNAYPNLTLATTVNNVCGNDPLTLTASGANTYSWSTGEVTPVITNTQTTDVIYTVTGTSNGCSQSESTTVTHNPYPNMSLISSVNTVCGNDPVTLTANGANTYLWSTGDATPSITEIQTADVAYTVTGTSNGCSVSESKTITHNAYPNLALISSVNTVCGSDPVTLTASGANSYLWSTADITPSITKIQTTDVTYTVTGTSNGCSANESTTITHNPYPNLSLVSSVNTICGNDPVTLTASGANTYLWSTGDVTPSITETQTGDVTYSVTGTSNGCSVNDNTTITHNDNPNLALVSSVNSVCGNDTVTLTASGANSYSWISGQATPIIKNTQIADVTYTVIGTSNGCSLEESITIDHNPYPNLTLISTMDSLCGNDPVTLTASGANTYLWSTGDVTPVITETQTADVTYTVTGTSNGCSINESKTIIQNQYPIVTLNTSSNDVCDGEYFTLTAGGANSYLWSNGGIGATQNISENTIAIHSYSVTGTSNGCSTTPAAVDVNVKTNPIVNINSSDTQICQQDTVTLTAIGTATDYLWSTSASTLFITESPTFTTLYGLIGELNGCFDTASQTIIVHDFNEAIISGSNYTCEGEAITLSAQNSVNYAWSTGGNATDETVLINSDTIIRLITKASPECPDTAYHQITTNINPVLNAGISEVCLDENVTYNLNLNCQTANFEINQYQNTTLVDIIKPLTVLDSINSYVAIDDSGCSSNNLQILARLIPDVNVQLSEYEGCDPLEVDFSYICDFTSDIITNQWDFGDGTSSDVQFPTNTYTHGTYDVFSTHEFINGCVDSVILIDTLYVERVAEASILADKYFGDKIQSVFNFTDDSKYHNSVIWTIDGDYISEDTLFEHDFLNVGIYELALFATTPLNCTDSTSVSIEINDNEQFLIPNSFSPNGDGINETFKPSININQDQILKYEFRVFNKWGNLIFETQDVNQSWDGLMNGSGIKQSVFVWNLNVDYYEYTTQDIKSSHQKGHVFMLDGKN